MMRIHNLSSDKQTRTAESVRASLPFAGYGKVEQGSSVAFLEGYGQIS